MIRFARECGHHRREDRAASASVIIGAGVNQWYHCNLRLPRRHRRRCVLCGCIGQERRRAEPLRGPGEARARWPPGRRIAFALDWARPAPAAERAQLPLRPLRPVALRAVRRGRAAEPAPPSRAPSPPRPRHGPRRRRPSASAGCPSSRSSTATPSRWCEDARADGATTRDAEVLPCLGESSQLKEKKAARFSVRGPGRARRTGRASGSSGGATPSCPAAKGHEYLLQPLPGHPLQHGGGRRPPKGEVGGRDLAGSRPRGKLDLVVDLNFRMDTTALYSDIILPAATWYEKNDLNSTDLHSYIHPLQAAVPALLGVQERLGDLQGDRREVRASWPTVHLPEPVKDLVTRPLQHDTPDELAQPELRDWARGECEPDAREDHAGALRTWTRDYVNLHRALRLARPGRCGPRASAPTASPGRWTTCTTSWSRDRRTEEWGGARYPSIADALDAANVILHLAPETNGEVVLPRLRGRGEEDRAFRSRTWRRGSRNVPHHLRRPGAAAAPPHRLALLDRDHRRTAGPTRPSAMNVERLVPWRTLTGRQHFYLDHPALHRLRGVAAHLQAQAQPRTS